MPDGANRTLLERHKAVLPKWMGLYYEEPIALERGEGRHVWDTQGRKYLDFFAGIVTTISGHAVPEIVAAVQDQAAKMMHSSTFYLIDSQIELAEEIAARSRIPDAKVFLTNSGSEANDLALMLATAYRRSNQVLAMRYSYHGRSFSTVPVTGIKAWSASPLSPFHVQYVHGSYRYRTPFGDLPDSDYIGAAVADLENILEVGTAGDVACLIAEPIQGVGGFAYGPDGMFGRFKEVLDRHGILFISDEVQTGWGRTGEHYWGYEAHGMTPDILTFAKGIGNGLAMGGVVARGDIMDALPANSLSTFGGNPLACRGALANLHYLDTNGLQGNAAKIGAVMRARVDALAAKYPFVGQVRGKGLMIGMECVEPGTKTPDTGVTARLLEETKARGLLIGRGGFYGNVVRMAPPLSLTEGEAEEGLGLLEEAFAAAAA